MHAGSYNSGSTGYYTICRNWLMGTLFEAQNLIFSAVTFRQKIIIPGFDMIFGTNIKWNMIVIKI